MRPPGYSWDSEEPKRGFWGLKRKNPSGDNHSDFISFFGAPGRIRTCDLRLRRPVLYPAELRARSVR